MMETKEQKPWYETADWGAEDCGSIYGHTAISGRMSDGSMHHSFAQVVTTLCDKSYQLGEDALSFIINAPKVATQRDSLLSVQKQLVEALEAARSSLEATDGYLMYLKDKGAKSSLLETCLKTNEATIQQTIAAILAAKASS
jgi:hypothetical protein